MGEIDCKHLKNGDSCSAILGNDEEEQRDMRIVRVTMKKHVATYALSTISAESVAIIWVRISGSQRAT